MPTNLIEVGDTYHPITQVLATEQGLRSPLMRTIDPAYMLSDENGQKILTPGTLISGIIGSTYGRPFPGTRLRGAIAATDTVLPVQNAQAFRVGEVVSIATPFAQANLALTWANGDTATMTIDGLTVGHVVTGFSTLAALATAIATTFNNSPLSLKASFVAVGNSVQVYGKRSFPIAAAETTAGDGTFAMANAASMLNSGISLGTITAVNAIAPTGATITLAAATNRALPANAPITSWSGEVLGMVISPTDLLRESNDVAIYTSASVYRDRLPFWDDFMSLWLPEITLV